DVKRMPLNRRGQLNCIEQIAGRTGKNRDTVGRRLQLGLEIARDALEVLVQTLAFGRVIAIRAAPRGELLSDEGLVLVFSGRARLRIEIQAHDWIWRLLKCGEAVELVT